MVVAGVYKGWRASGNDPEARNSCSGTLLPEHFRWLSHQSRQPDQVVRRATEDEQPVHFLQASQLDLAQRASLLQPSECLFDQPSATQTDGIAGLARGSTIQVAQTSLFVPRNVGRKLQLPPFAAEV